MKTKILAILLSAMALSTTNGFAQREGGGATGIGGGGDDSEARVNEIRSDILSWINRGGSKGLKLPFRLDYYNHQMKYILAPKYVVVTFVEKDDSSDEELRVEVDGRPKTCRGFLSKKDSRYNIVCNRSKFNQTSEDGQYRLIHHEYAGLVGLERNEGAASDYEISNQLSGYLTKTTVLRLAITKPSEQSGTEGMWSCELSLPDYASQNCSYCAVLVRWKKDTHIMKIERKQKVDDYGLQTLVAGPRSSNEFVVTTCNTEDYRNSQVCVPGRKPHTGKHDTDFGGIIFGNKSYGFQLTSNPDYLAAFINPTGMDMEFYGGNIIKKRIGQCTRIK